MASFFMKWIVDVLIFSNKYTDILSFIYRYFCLLSLCYLSDITFSHPSQCRCNISVRTSLFVGVGCGGTKVFGQPCRCFGLSGASVRCTLLPIGFVVLAQMCSNQDYPFLSFVRACCGTKTIAPLNVTFLCKDYMLSDINWQVCP